MSASTPRIDSIEGNALVAASTSASLTLIDMSEENLIDVPYTTISNRKKILNLASDAGVKFGVNRIPIQGLHHIHSEYGTSGKGVQGVTGDDLGLIRFVGGWRNAIEGSGRLVISQTAEDYLEVTFYGTALTILTMPYSTPGNDLRVSVDGGAEGSNITPAIGSFILNSNFAPNVRIVATSGLALGIHTVKIRTNSNESVRIWGVEVITEGTQLKVNPGNVIGSSSGLKTISSQQTVDYGSSFETGSLTSTGGRVFAYLKSDGTIGKSATPIGTPAFLTSADHTNEEVIRIDNYRQYGNGLTTDFHNIGVNQSLGVVDRAWALEDNHSVLYAHRVTASVQAVAGAFSVDRMSPYTNSWIVFNFVGTGLDLQDFGGGAGPDNFAVTVDGTNVGNISGTIQGLRTVKICSGLPYGSHTVRIDIATPSVDYFNLLNMIIYGPKKPAIPEGAVLLADYNVLADYVANTTAGQHTIAQGVLRNSNMREINYVGATWALGAEDTSNFVNGRNVETSTDGDYLEYTFFGTGLEYRFLQTAAMTTTYLLNGVAMNTTNYPTMVVSAYGDSLSFAGNTLTDAATGNQTGAGLSISGLPLGLYTIRITLGVGSTGLFYPDSFDVITPIHAYQNSKLAIGNNMAIGSQSLRDARVVLARKAIIDTTATCGGSIPSNSGVIQIVPGLGGKIELDKDAELEIHAIVSGQLNNSGVNMRVYVGIDGMFIGDGQANYGSIMNHTTGYYVNFKFQGLITASKGTHYIQVYFQCDSNTFALTSGYNQLLVREL